MSTQELMKKLWRKSRAVLYATEVVTSQVSENHTQQPDKSLSSFKALREQLRMEQLRHLSCARRVTAQEEEGPPDSLEQLEIGAEEEPQVRGQGCSKLDPKSLHSHRDPDKHDFWYRPSRM